MPDILLLKGDREPSKSSAVHTWQALQRAGNANYFLEPYSDIVFRIQKGVVSGFLHNSGRDLASFDLVYIRDFHGYEHERNAVALYLGMCGRTFINDDVGRFQHISKLTQYLALAANNITMPDMIYAKQAYLPQITDLPYPVVCKSAVGSNGADNVVIRTPGDFAKYSIPNAVVQPFIPNDYDMRVIVADDQILLTYKRIRSDTRDHRNNVAMGARREIITNVPPAVARLAIHAARTLGRNLAGVDIVQDKNTDTYYVLEVNFNFGMGDLDDGVAAAYYQRLAVYLAQKAQ